MRLLRLIFTMLIVVGLAAPTARASAVTIGPPAMEDCAGMKAMGNDDCPCCHEDSKCPASVCAIKCLKTVGGHALLSLIPIGRSETFSTARPGAMAGIGLRPPSPPPRV